MVMANCGVIDIVAVDNGKPLLIISEHRDWSKRPVMLEQLRMKVFNYVEYSKSDDYKKKFGNVQPKIILHSVFPLNIAASGAINELKKKHGVEIEVKVDGDGSEVDNPETEYKERTTYFSKCCVFAESLFKGFFEKGLDYSHDSLVLVDKKLGALEKELRENENKRQKFIDGFGAYLGEVIIRNLGGKWAETIQGWGIENVGDLEMIVFPFTKVKKRIMHGEGDSLHFYFTAIKKQVEKLKKQQETNPQ